MSPLRCRSVFPFCFLNLRNRFRFQGLRCTYFIFRSKILVTVFSAIIFLILFNIFGFYKKNFTCSIDEEVNVFENICDLHNQKLAFGNLCDTLCVKKEIQLLNCIVHHSGKEVVIVALWNDTKIVLKSSHKDVNKFDQVYFSDNTEIPVNVYPEMDLFLDMTIQSVSSYLNSSFKLSPKSQIVELVWTLNYSFLKNLKPKYKHAAMSNIWHLLQQPEYIISKIYAHERVFPKVVGSCGHFYAVEYLNPVDSFFGVLHPSWRYSFETRAILALDLIRLFESYENRFHSVLHICDVKIGHFGFTSDGKLRLLDLDMAYFEETLQTNMKAPSSCHSNYDCAFIDCHGSCRRGQCQSDITNNNFQRLCTNIFYGYFGQDIFGLLGSPPLQHRRDLKEQLLLCMKNPSLGEKAIKKIKSILTTAVTIHKQPI